MKRVLLLLVLLAPALYAQTASQAALPTPTAVNANVTERNVTVTTSDLYCAGFVTRTAVGKDHFVAGGLNTPHQSRFSTGDYIYLRGGTYQPGTRVSLVREVQDPNRFTAYAGVDQLLKQAGQQYADLGYAVVVENRGVGIAVAKVEFTCDTLVQGDQVVPFVAKQPIAYRRLSTMDQFPAAPASVAGRIIAAKDFNGYVGSGHKVYINLGTDRGLKPGDYLRVVRGYNPKEFDGADASVFNATIAEDTQKNPPSVTGAQLKDLPRHVVGEVIVLSTQAGTATAMVTFALEELHVGDFVEVEQ